MRVLPVSMLDFSMLCRLWKEGHTCVEPNVLVEAAQELLIRRRNSQTASQCTCTNQSLVLSPPVGDLQFPTTSHSELKIAEALHLLLGGNSKLPHPPEKAIDWAQKKAGSLSHRKADALRMALTSRVSILTGGPGTGKTTILRALVAILRAKNTNRTRLTDWSSCPATCRKRQLLSSNIAPDS